MITIFTLALATTVIWLVWTYNKLIRLIEAVNNNNNQIDVQLDRRYKVYEALIEVVKKYMDYEKTVLKDVVALRNQAQKALASGDIKERIAKEDAISKFIPSIQAVFEQYPDLKANQNALQLQEEISNTENKLAFAKQSYNDSLEIYNATQKSFPAFIVVGFAPTRLLKNFTYWGVTEAKRQEHENYKPKI